MASELYCYFHQSPHGPDCSCVRNAPSPPSIIEYNSAIMNLSVIIPVYNEANNIHEIIKRVQATKMPAEIIVVDDGSQDGTRDALKTMDGKKKVRVIFA